jgi:RNA methyltransferase, TrmH family
MITSNQNAKLKLARSLMGRPKERHAAQAFVAEGVRLVEEALSAGWPVRFILHTPGLSTRGLELVKRCEEQGYEVEQVSEAFLNSVSEMETSQGLLAVLDYSPLPLPQQLDFVLIADSIRDPGNLGTLLRTAAAAGVQAVFLTPETTDAFAPKVLRAGMGAHFRLPIHNLSWDEIRGATEALKVYLADMQGAPCWQNDFRAALALIVGGEAEGATQAAHSLADETVCIPMPGKAESLNAGVAGAILMFEVVRQRQLDPSEN